MTFAEVAQLWQDNRKDGLCKAHADRVWLRMERDVLPVLGEQTSGAITAPKVLSVIGRSKHVARSILAAVLSRASVRCFGSRSPTAGRRMIRASI